MGSDLKRDVFAEAQGALALCPVFSKDDLSHFLLLRPKAAIDSVTFEIWIEPLSQETITIFLRKLLTETKTHELTRFLWILSKSEICLTDKIRKKLKELLSVNDDTLKGFTYRFIWAYQDKKLIDHILAQKRSRLDLENNWADAWIFAFLNEHPKEKEFDELCTTLPLPQLAEITVNRGLIVEEVKQVAFLLDQIWQRISGKHNIKSKEFPTVEVNTFSDHGKTFTRTSACLHTDKSHRFLSIDSVWGNIPEQTTEDLKDILKIESDKEFHERQQAIYDQLKNLAKNETTMWWDFSTPH